MKRSNTYDKKWFAYEKVQRMQDEPIGWPWINWTMNEWIYNKDIM